MTILNRYILRKFLRPFLASFSALVILIIVSQVFEQLDRFLQHGVKITYVIGYLLTSTPFQALQVLPVACLLGTLFTIGELARTREYIAGLAGGIPPEKFLTGLLIAGLSISVFAFIANETIVPPTTRYATSVYDEKIRHLGDWRQSTLKDVFVAGSEGRVWSIRYFYQSVSKMDRVIVDTFQDNQLKNQIDASEAEWDHDGWVFRRGVLRTFLPDNLNLDQMESFKEKKFAFKEKPADFMVHDPQPEQMTYKTLKKYIRRLAALGVDVRKLEVELMMKLSFPFTCLVVVALGIPLAMKGKGNRAKGIASAGMLTLAYMGFVQFGKALAQRLIAPVIGAWLGNIVFIVIGTVLWVRMRRAA